MTQEEITEGNRIIREWIGKSFLIEKFKTMSQAELLVDNITNSPGKFHTSWDWLMPVVEKWNDLVVSKRSEPKDWTKWQFQTIMLSTNINKVFAETVSKLKWHNSIKP